MLSVRERVSQATREQLDSQWSATATLADKTVDSIEQLSDLNINLARATFEQSNLVVRQLATVETARQFLLLAAAQAKPNTGRAFDYGYYLSTIASSAQEEFIKAIGMRIADTNRMLIELLAELSNAAPDGFTLTNGLIQSLAEGAKAACEQASAPTGQDKGSVPGAERDVTPQVRARRHIAHRQRG